MSRTSYVPIPKISRESINGTYCNFSQGDKFADYIVEKRLGSGRFSTVWEVSDSKGDKYAIKVYKNTTREHKYYINEVRMLTIVSLYLDKLTKISCNLPPLIKYYGTFAYTTINDDFCPHVYPCVIFQLAGDHIGRYLRRGAFTIPVAKSIMRQIFSGLVFLHKRNIIHTDIKPENIFVMSVKYDNEALNAAKNTFLAADDTEKFDDTPFITDIEVVIGDLGTSTPSDTLFSRTVGTIPYLAPELLINEPYTSSIDIWAAYTLFFELISGSLLFDVYSETDINYGKDISEYRGSINSSDYSTGSSISDDSSNSSQSDSDVGSDANTDADSHDYYLEEYQIAFRHLKLMEKILGRPPKSFTCRNRKFFNMRGRLIGNPAISRLQINEILVSQFGISADDALNAEKFLLDGLKYECSKRPTAEKGLLSAFLMS